MRAIVDPVSKRSIIESAKAAYWWFEFADPNILGVGGILQRGLLCDWRISLGRSNIWRLPLWAFLKL